MSFTGYKLSWVQVVLGMSFLGTGCPGMSCPEYELSSVRVFLSTICPGYKLSLVRVFLGTRCPGCELFWV